MRIVSATNRNLIDDVKSGRFREDLFYRLHVFPIAVPPLRERAEDIPDLVRHFLARIAAEEGKRVRTVSGEALALLGRHRWPGNVRQLENAVFRAVVLAEGDSIGVDEFPQIAAQVAGAVRAGRTNGTGRSRSDAPAMMHLPRARRRAGDGAVEPADARRARRCSTITATCARSRRSKPRRSASPSRITAARCRRSRGGCRSAARRSTASWKISDLPSARRTKLASARNRPKRINAAR